MRSVEIGQAKSMEDIVIAPHFIFPAVSPTAYRPQRLNTHFKRAGHLFFFVHGLVDDFPNDFLGAECRVCFETSALFFVSGVASCTKQLGCSLFFVIGVASCSKQ